MNSEEGESKETQNSLAMFKKLFWKFQIENWSKLTTKLENRMTKSRHNVKSQSVFGIDPIGIFLLRLGPVPCFIFPKGWDRSHGWFLLKAGTSPISDFFLKAGTDPISNFFLRPRPVPTVMFSQGWDFLQPNSPSPLTVPSVNPRTKHGLIPVSLTGLKIWNSWSLV